jgi:hypothetical protein
MISIMASFDKRFMAKKVGNLLFTSSTTVSNLGVGKCRNSLEKQRQNNFSPFSKNAPARDKLPCRHLSFAGAFLEKGACPLPAFVPYKLPTVVPSVNSKLQTFFAIKRLSNEAYVLTQVAFITVNSYLALFWKFH